MGGRAHHGNNQEPRSNDDRGTGNQTPEARRKTILGMASEPPGGNGSERMSSPESSKARRSSPLFLGEGSMGRQDWQMRLSHSGGVAATARRQGCIAQLEKPYPPREKSPENGRPNNRRLSGKWAGRREGGGRDCNSSEQGQCPGSEGSLLSATPLTTWKAGMG